MHGPSSACAVSDDYKSVLHPQYACAFDNSYVRTYILKCSYRLEMISYGLATSGITCAFTNNACSSVETRACQKSVPFHEVTYVCKIMHCSYISAIPSIHHTYITMWKVHEVCTYIGGQIARSSMHRYRR